LLRQLYHKYFDHVSSLQLFQVLKFSSSILIGICFTKIPLSQPQIGVYELFMLISTGLSFFWLGGMTNTLLSAYPKQDDGIKHKMLFNSFVLVSLVSTLLVVILAVFPSTVVHLFTKGHELPYFTWFCVYLLLSNCTGLLEFYLLLIKRIRLLIFSGLFYLVIQLLLVVIPVWMGYGIRGALIGLVIFNAFRLTWLLVIFIREQKFDIDFSLIKKLFIDSLPLTGSMLISGAFEYINGFLISTHYSAADFAVYRYGARELPLSMLLANAFSAASIPLIAVNINDGLAYVKRRSLQLFHLLFPLSIILMLTSYWLFPVVFNPQFQQSALVFNIFLLLIASRILFPQTILNALGKYNIILLFSVIEIIIGVGLSMYWINTRLGMYGVALATVVTYLLNKLFLMSYLAIKLKIPPAKYISIEWYLFYVVVLILSFAASVIMITIDLLK
jgi:O-antigen/teichoic acid export membrane protein